MLKLYIIEEVYLLGISMKYQFPLKRPFTSDIFVAQNCFTLVLLHRKSSNFREVFVI